MEGTMKAKKKLLGVVTASFIAVVLCVSASMVMAAGVNPGTPVGYKQLGPTVKGSLIIGWHPYVTGENVGRVEVHLIIEGKLYAGVPLTDVHEGTFLDPTPNVTDTQEEAWNAEIRSWDFPEEIAADNNLPPEILADVLVKVFGEKDISNLRIKENLLPVDYPHQPSEYLTYLHVVYCDVRITFFEPVKK